MAKVSTWIPITTLVFMWFLISSASATTDASDVSALQDLYRNLSYPSQLTGWKSKGGDPCEEQWKGISCDGSSIIYIKLNGLDLGGYLGKQLNLMNLKQLDLSSNHIQGKIPSLLAPNAINMDLSFNKLSGDLPCSLTCLTNLTGLYLHNNSLTGSAMILASLPLHDLNLENNSFSGAFPKQLQHVTKLRNVGNAFQTGEDFPHWKVIVVCAMEVAVISSCSVFIILCISSPHLRKKLMMKDRPHLHFVWMIIVCDVLALMCDVFIDSHRRQLQGDMHYSITRLLALLISVCSSYLTFVLDTYHPSKWWIRSVDIILELSHVSFCVYGVTSSFLGVMIPHEFDHVANKILIGSLVFHFTHLLTSLPIPIITLEDYFRYRVLVATDLLQ